jgi:hypothetical protein
MTRPFAQTTYFVNMLMRIVGATIGAWLTVQSAMSIFAVICNACMICFVSSVLVNDERQIESILNRVVSVPYSCPTMFCNI